MYAGETQSMGHRPTSVTLRSRSSGAASWWTPAWARDGTSHGSHGLSRCHCPTCSFPPVAHVFHYSTSVHGLQGLKPGKTRLAAWVKTQQLPAGFVLSITYDRHRLRPSYITKRAAVSAFPFFYSIKRTGHWKWPSRYCKYS